MFKTLKNKFKSFLVKLLFKIATFFFDRGAYQLATRFARLMFKFKYSKLIRESLRTAQVGMTVEYPKYAKLWLWSCTLLSQEFEVSEMYRLKDSEVAKDVLKKAADPHWELKRLELKEKE